MSLYYQDDLVTLYHGDFRDHLSAMHGDAIVTDPPYGETSLQWDRWPTDWPSLLTGSANALWCFGSFRMFMENLDDFGGWKFSHEIVWEKHNGSSFVADKFKRVHELATLWYQGAWGDLRHEVPRVASTVPDRGFVSASRVETAHTGKITKGAWIDDGKRLQTTVIKVRSTHFEAVHPTQKPLGIVTPLIEYSVPLGGTVIDPFAGSGTTLVAARNLGRRGVGVEAKEAFCEAAARRLSQQAFNFGDIA